MNIFEDLRGIILICILYSKCSKILPHIGSGISADSPSGKHLIKLRHLKKNTKIIVQVILGDSKTLRGGIE